MNDVNYRQLSKTIAHALRHAPWIYELVLDEQGWTPTAALLTALHERKRWRHITFDHLRHLVTYQTKIRYEMEGDESGRIRALYGHSIHAKIAKEAAVPPDILYHGTAPETVPLILESGLLPMSRQYVHLSADKETARQVGDRKVSSVERPVLLEVRATAAHSANILFYRGNDLVWLADQVPPEFIDVPE